MEVDSSPMGGAAMGWWDNEGVNVRIFQSKMKRRDEFFARL